MSRQLQEESVCCASLYVFAAMIVYSHCHMQSFTMLHFHKQRANNAMHNKHDNALMTAGHC